ncbi:MAG: MFS transporter [Microbacterium gubbeenense]|uniref:MFS transporter n=1 Tax=Microbacterium gubbeenense TaxID=159896 RepID=UPI0003F98B78|nr:MFS transporter [Microbacterium gubbeenense]
MTGQPAARGAAGRAIRAYWPMIYAPTAMYSMGQGALIPVLPKIAAHHAAGLAPEALLPAAALVAAMIPVGQLCGNLPAGVFIARFGERAAMIVAAGISLVGIAVMLLAPNIAVLGLGALLIGTCASVFALARHAFMTTRAPLAFRARALALIGGSFRLGTFTGPLMAAGLIAMTGSETSTLWFFGACLVAMGLLVAFGPDPETRAAADDRARRARERSMELEDTGEPVTGSIPAAGRHGLFATIRRHRGVLARLGLSAASMAAVRAGRQAILPLWGLAIGLESWQISLIVGFAGAAEFSLFYASGQVMDRFGRIWATVPSQLMMGLSLLCLALTHNAGSAEIAFAVCAIIIGIGNGLSSGALMTLGSDQAPQDDPAPFLGAWRTMTDGGASATPLLVAGITAIASLPVATGVIGAIGLVGALGFMRWVPRYSPNR